MNSVICHNNTNALIEQLKEYLEKGGTIGGLAVVDSTDDQLVLLIDNEPINAKMAKVWWEGYQAALR